MAVALVLPYVVLPSWAGDPPDHYFSGYVCRGKKEVATKLEGYRCEWPIKGATITASNSKGEVVVTRTDRHGHYSLPPIRLYGTEADRIVFEKPHFVALHVVRLTFDPGKGPVGKGATILLPRQNVERMMVY